MITILDYGAGNLRSVQKSIEYIGYKAEITNDPEVVSRAELLVFPGNGAFGDCMTQVKQNGLYDAILEVINKGNPFLGICIGMQLLFEKGYEFGTHEGFKFFQGDVSKFPDEMKSLGYKIPHTGWNSCHINTNHPLFRDIEQDSYFYFVHSYFASGAKENHVIGKTNYHIDFISAVASDNIMAVQFHPEKSQKAGLKLLENFCKF